MKYLFLMLFLVSCSKTLTKYKYGDCVIPNSEHFYAGVVFQLRDITFDEYLGCTVDQSFECEHFEEDEIEQAVNCPLKL